MNSLMFTNTFTPHIGGVARSVQGLVEGLRHRGHRVLVVAPAFAGIVESEALRLVVMIAFKHKMTFRNLQDVIQEGNMGLMVALKKYDPYRGIRLPSYAVWWIRAYIIRYVMKNWRIVKVGTTETQRMLFFNLLKEKQRLEAKGFTTEPKLLAQRFGVKEREAVAMEQRLSNSDLSIDMPIGADGSLTLHYILADGRQSPEECLAEAQYRQVLKERMEQFTRDLKDKELVIFRDRLLTDDPLTLREIGERYGITRERVRQIEERVKKKLRAYLCKEFKDLKEPAFAIGAS